MNEYEKNGLGGVGGHIDVTPMAKLLGWKGGTSQKRRVYIRFAKQATEVWEGWLTKPLDTLFGKTSILVKVAWEQMSEETMSGWDTDFKDMGVAGIFTGKDRGFAGSRLGSIGVKFLPMSVASLTEGRPSSFFAPASQGMSLGKAQDLYGQVLASYADEGTWKQLLKNPRARTNLHAFGKDILDAAKRNGYDPEEVIKGGKRAVLTKIYRDMFAAIQREDYKEVNAAAGRAVRVNGSYKNALSAMKKRKETANEKITQEERDAVRKAFGLSD